MHDSPEQRTRAVWLDVMATVTAVSREDGRRERIRVVVPCPIREFGTLPIVGRFQLARRKEIVRFGLDGRPFGLHEELHDYGATFRTPTGNFAGPWCTEILGEKLPRPTKSEFPLPFPALAPKGRLGDPALAGAWDLEPDAARIAAIKERAAADFAVCAGELLTAAPFPRWCVGEDGGQIDLVRVSDEHRLEENYFAAERLGAAEELAAIRNGEHGRAWCSGKVVAMDPAYQLDRDEVFLARGVGRYFADKFRVPVFDLPGDLVRAWHDVSTGLRMRCDSASVYAIDVIASGFRLMAAFEACPELSGRAGPLPDPWWCRIRERIVQVDGLGPQVLPATHGTVRWTPCS